MTVGIYPSSASAIKHIEDKILTVLKLYLNDAIDAFNALNFEAGSEQQLVYPTEIKQGRMATLAPYNHISASPTICYYISNDVSLGYDVTICRTVQYNLNIACFEMLNNANPVWTDKRCAYLRNVVADVLEKYLRDPTGIGGLTDGSISLYDASIVSSQSTAPTPIGNNYYVVNAQATMALKGRVTYEDKPIYLQTETFKDAPYVISLGESLPATFTCFVSGSGSFTGSLTPNKLTPWTLSQANIVNVGDGIVTFPSSSIPNDSEVFVNFAYAKTSAYYTVSGSFITIPSGTLQASIHDDREVAMVAITSGTRYHTYYNLGFTVI